MGPNTFVVIEGSIVGAGRGAITPQVDQLQLLWTRPNTVRRMLNMTSSLDDQQFGPPIFLLLSDLQGENWSVLRVGSFTIVTLFKTSTMTDILLAFRAVPSGFCPITIFVQHGRRVSY